MDSTIGDLMRILVSIFFVMYATTSYANIVEQAQRLLTHLGYNVGVIDGLYGGKTERALTDFYNTQGAKYDGKLDQNEITDLLANFPNKINYCFDEHTSSSGENHTESNFVVDDLFTRQITSIPFYQRGTFGSKTSKTDELEVDAIITSVADVNLDGIDDLLIEYIETMVPPLIMLGTKDGTFNRLGNVDLNSARRHIREGYFKDINNDEFPDFIGFTTGDHTEYFKEQGITNLPAGEPDLLMINDNGKSFKALELPEAYKNDVNHGGLIADINADGLLDIISLTEEDGKKTYPLINIGDGKFEKSKRPLPSIVTKHWIEDGEAGDLNNDGYDDLVISLQKTMNNANLNRLDRYNTLLIILGDGDTNYSNNTTGTIGEYWFDKDILKALQKFDNQKYGENISLKEIEFGTANIELIDINKDGRLDIVEGQFIKPKKWSTSGFQVYLNEPDCFRNVTAKYFPNQTVNKYVKNSRYTKYINNFYFKDIDGDGKEDLLLQALQGRTWLSDVGKKQYPYIFIQQDEGYFSPIETRNAENLIELDNIVSGDFNGDGKSDLAGIDRGERAEIVSLIYAPKPKKTLSPKPENKYWRDHSNLVQKFECFIQKANELQLNNLPSEDEIKETIENITDNKGYLRPIKIIKAGISKAVFSDHKKRITRLVNYEGDAAKFCQNPILR